MASLGNALLVVLAAALRADPGDIPPSTTDASAPPIPCRVVQETAEGYFVDVGEEAGILVGARGWLRRAGGEPLVQVEVATVTKNSALLKPFGEHRQGLTAPNDELSLLLDRVGVKGTPGGSRSSSLKDQTKDQGPFSPLLAAPDLAKEGFTEVKNIFHGRLSFDQMAQLTSGGNHDAFRTRLNFSGNVERIEATPWDAEWSVSAFYRDGKGLDRAFDYESPRLETYRLALYRRFDEGGFVRIGRFLPMELPSVGYLDGAQAEKVLTPHFRIGGMIGLKPNRDRLVASVDEPTAVGYGTWAAGDPSRPFYVLTTGFLFSFFNGTPDRLAWLAEQRLQLKRLTLTCGSEVDFDVGGTEVHSGTRLTRLDLAASYFIAPILTVRAGVDRWERPDTEAERQSLDLGFLQLQDLFDRGYNRYWVGASHNLPLRLFLSEEVSVTDSTFETYFPRWNASLTRTGLPGLPDSSLTCSVSAFRGQANKGFSARISGLFNLLTHRLTLMPSIGYRSATNHAISDIPGFRSFETDLKVVDFSLRANLVLNRQWSGSAGLQFTAPDKEDAVLIDVGVIYRW